MGELLIEISERLTPVSEKSVLVRLANDLLEDLIPFETYHVPHHFIHEAEGTVGEEDHLFPTDHQAAQDGKDYFLSQEELLYVSLDPLV